MTSTTNNIIYLLLNHTFHPPYFLELFRLKAVNSFQGCSQMADIVTHQREEHGGSVVECLTPDREIGGSSLTRGTALFP